MSEQYTALKSGNMKIEDQPFLASQSTAVADGFKNVSKTWYDKTISFDDGIDLLTKGKAETEDIHLPMEAVSFEEQSSKLAINLDGNAVFPTKHALGQIAARLDIPSKILTNWYDTGDSEDIQTVIKVLNNGKRKYLNEELSKKEDDEDTVAQKFRWRTRKDQSLRALVSQKFLPLDNQFFLESLAKIIPNGRLSHWSRTDADSICGNIFIPDTLRKESDSDYSGGCAVGNSEIGLLALNIDPFLYRFVCQNGCIHSRVSGVSYSRKHLGTKIDYQKQFDKIKDAINKQIPLIDSHIDSILLTKDMSWSGSVKALLVQAAADLMLNKKQATEMLLAYEIEPELSCFGLINAITRASQKMDAMLGYEMDKYAGSLVSEKAWLHYSAKSKAMEAKEVESYFVTVS